jgi:nicotinamidase-related amidase
MLLRSNRNSSLLRADDTLLMVIDMQEPFLRGIWERDRVVENVATLMKAAKILRVPIVPTLQYQERMGGCIPEIARLLPALSEPFDKLSFSCMGDDAITSEVNRSGRKQVLLCGVETHVCVHQTALDLQALGFQVHVAADAVSSRTERNWQVGLERMRSAGIQISSVEMAAFELMVEAGTPEFREIISLLK